MKPQHILGKYLGKVGHSVRRPKGILSPVCTQLRWMSCMQWCVWVCVRQALKVKQDVFSGRRPFQSRQIPDNLSKFPLWYRPRIIQPCLFPYCLLLQSWESEKRKLGPFFPQMRAVYSLKLSHSQDPPRLQIWIWPDRAAVAVVGEIYDGRVGAVAKTHSNPHFSSRVESARQNNRDRKSPLRFFAAVLHVMLLPKWIDTIQVSSPALKVNRVKSGRGWSNNMVAVLRQYGTSGWLVGGLVGWLVARN